MAIGTRGVPVHLEIGHPRSQGLALACHGIARHNRRHYGQVVGYRPDHRGQGPWDIWGVDPDRAAPADGDRGNRVTPVEAGRSLASTLPTTT